MKKGENIFWQLSFLAQTHPWNFTSTVRSRWSRMALCSSLFPSPSAWRPLYFLSPHSLFICVPVSAACAAFWCHLGHFFLFPFFFVILLFPHSLFCQEMFFPFPLFFIFFFAFNLVRSFHFSCCVFRHVEITNGKKTHTNWKSVKLTLWHFPVFFTYTCKTTYFGDTLVCCLTLNAAFQTMKMKNSFAPKCVVSTLFTGLT